MIYGVALLAGCMFLGSLVGNILGLITGLGSDIGGVGFAMLLLLIVVYILTVKRGDSYVLQPFLIGGALVGAVAAFIVAIILRDALPDQVIVSGEIQGLTTWRLLYRHMSSVLVGLLTMLTVILHRMECRAERRKTQAAFDPTASTIGLDSFGGDNSTYQKPKKLKRSLRHKQEKQEQDTTSMQG